MEGPRKIKRHSVISAGHYINVQKPHETIAEVMGGRHPKLLMDIHSVSEVNKNSVHLSAIEGPATAEVFNEGNGFGEAPDNYNN
jgi:NADH-quinone oxidoreductase subunit G